jgi:hypothetical protein
MTTLAAPSRRAPGAPAPAWRGAYAAPFVILVHSHLGVGWESTGIVRGAGGFGDGGDDDQPPFGPSFNPPNAAIVVCDEDPTTSLIECRPLEKEALTTITEQNLGAHILAGLDAPGGLLSCLREKGITPEQVRAMADGLRGEERKRGQIASPSASDAVVGKAAMSAAPLVRLSRVLERLADELASGRSGPAYSLVPEGTRVIAQGRQPWPFHQRRLLVLVPTENDDGIVPLELIASNMTFYKGRLIKRASGPNDKGAPEPTALLLEVADFIEKTARKGNTLVVTNKPVRCALTGEDEGRALRISAKYRGADIAHYGNLRGSDGTANVEILKQFVPTLRAAPEIRVARKARVVRQEFSEFGPGWCVAEAADQLALMVDNTDPRPEIGNVTADGGGRADFADVADRLVTVWHVEATRAVEVLPLRLVSAVTIEYLDPMVLPVRDIDPAVGVTANVVDDVELALAGSGLAPRHQQFAVE